MLRPLHMNLRATPAGLFCRIAIRNWLAIAVISLALTDALRGVADNRIWLKDAEINNKTLKLIFDSGSPYNFLSPEALKRLGLRFVPATTNDSTPGMWSGDTELCKISFNGINGQTTFVVLDLPLYVGADFDGGIGWCSMSQNVLRIDAISQEVTILSKVPRQSLRWSQFSVSTNFGTLDLRIPHGRDPEGILCVDTGFEGGVSLPKGEWVKWKKQHPQSATTLETSFSLTNGFEIQTEVWAEKISFGPIVLTDVPLADEGPKKTSLWGTNYEGTIGLAALRRMDFIVDGRNGTAYLSVKKTPPPSYTHNRLGAIFVPMGTHTNQAVARVVAGGPAYEAGVRDGDILLQVDEIACTSWNASWLSRFQWPAGTKLKLTVQRDGKTVSTTATLRDILHPSSDKK